MGDSAIELKTLPVVILTLVDFDIVSSCPDIELRSTQMEAKPPNLSSGRLLLGHAACVFKSREMRKEMTTRG